MKIYLVTSVFEQGYTQDNTGEPSNNLQIIWITEANSEQQAYNNLKKENPHLFAIDIEYGSARWTGFMFWELAGKKEPIKINVIQ